MWGAIIGGALSLASSLYSGIKASKAAKSQKKNTQALIRDNQAWYDRRYNENPLSRADAQQVLTRLQEAVRNRNQAAAGRAAVTGASQASVAAEKQANAAAIADAMGNINAQNANRKDEIEQQYMATKANLTGQMNNIEAQRANAIAQAGAAAGTALGNAGNSVDDYLDTYKKQKEQAAGY